MSRESDMVTLESVKIVRTIDHAYLLDYEDTKFWIAKSLIGNAEEVNILHTNGEEEIEELDIPEWLALKEGLI